jgi:hypothetical protein|tara:strand:+ start:668 stop:1159 length:492 start_codon:yes stop_codon:yes gene_type:complete
MGQVRQLQLARLRAKLPQTADERAVWADVSKLQRFWSAKYAETSQSKWGPVKYEFKVYEKKALFKLVDHYGLVLSMGMVWRFFDNSSGAFEVATWAEDRAVMALCRRSTLRYLLCDDRILNDPAVTIDSLKEVFADFLEGGQKDEDGSNDGPGGAVQQSLPTG